MNKINLDNMLFTISPAEHSPEKLISILKLHPEIKFVSLVGMDIGGHDTDEKIPVEAFIKDFDALMTKGVQTDGSSVALPKIAEINNAKVDIIPDKNVNWYVDHNFSHIDLNTGLPVGTLRIPSFLRHNDAYEVGSRVILRDAVDIFKSHLLKLLSENSEQSFTEKAFSPFEELRINSIDEIEEIILTSATELEFWVRTPDEEADREQLSTAQILKEQYWKRTIGPVRTALEQSIMVLDKYGLDVEMGHKEVGGIKAKLTHNGHYDHVMEQLEIDWKYAEALQAADNENQVKYVIKDIFRLHGLDVTFAAKPMEGIAGSGEHTHMGVATKLKDGRIENLFSPKNMKEDYLSNIGFGALMGLLKNYEVVNPFISNTNDAFNRLKPGYEAPVCAVTSLGHTADKASRNRTVLIGLVRDIKEPMATRFELRAPNPKSNTYLVLAASYMAMLDGIDAVIREKKTVKELEQSISKPADREDFYLEKGRLYRSEENVYEEYTDEERKNLFGFTPETVWENIRAFEDFKDKLSIFERGCVMSPLMIASYREAVLSQWEMEL
ncbi:MAG: glutamine synthetase, partial [Anaerovoracaceae bacterium]